MRLMSEEAWAAHQRIAEGARKVRLLPNKRGSAVKPSKYNAKACVIDGIRFASKKEGRRYSELKLMLAAGEISDLKCHPKFALVVDDMSVGNYIADFEYVKAGAQIIEDVKGILTPVFKLKARLMKAIHGIDILVT